MIKVLLMKLGIIEQVVIDDSATWFTTHKNSGEFIEGSINMTKVLGYTSDEWKNKSPYDYIHPEDIEDVLKSHLNTGTGVPKVLARLKRKDGVYIWVETRSTVIGGKIVTFNRCLRNKFI